jgi:hypothetical protein
LVIFPIAGFEARIPPTDQGGKAAQSAATGIRRGVMQETSRRGSGNRNKVFKKEK